MGNGKRFIAYGFAERLKKGGFADVVKMLEDWVNSTDRSHNKKHEVFEPSFDWKECNDEKLAEQKLTYIHENASKGEHRLVENPAEYEHSSARFYLFGEQPMCFNYHVAPAAGYRLNTGSGAAESLKRRLCGEKNDESPDSSLASRNYPTSLL